MKNQNGHVCRRLGLCLAVSLVAVGGCSHGSDDTGGNSSMGSMSGTTDRQYTQSIANQNGPATGGTSRSANSGSGSTSSSGSTAGMGNTTGTGGASSMGATSTGGSGTSGASMGTEGTGTTGSGGNASGSGR